MPFASGNSGPLPDIHYVLSRVQGDRCSPTAALGGSLFAAALRAHVRAQFLDGPRRISRPSVERPKLPEVDDEPPLCGSPSPYDAHRGVRHVMFSAARLPARVLLVLPCRLAQGTPLPTGDRSALGELPGARLCVENHPR